MVKLPQKKKIDTPLFVPPWASDDINQNESDGPFEWTWNTGQGDWDLSFYPNDEDYPTGGATETAEWMKLYLPKEPTPDQRKELKKLAKKIEKCLDI